MRRRPNRSGTRKQLKNPRNGRRSSSKSAILRMKKGRRRRLKGK